MALEITIVKPPAHAEAAAPRVNGDRRGENDAGRAGFAIHGIRLFDTERAFEKLSIGARPKKAKVFALHARVKVLALNFKRGFFLQGTVQTYALPAQIVDQAGDVRL